MIVSVLVPWSGGCPWREAAWEWVQARYRATHPAWEIVAASGDTEGGFSRSQGILRAAHEAAGDVLVVADADVWCDPMPAVQQAERHGWAIPHALIHRLSPEATTAVFNGSDWHGLPLSDDNHQDSRPYKGHETGTLVVLRRDVFNDAPPDPRFVGWGQEDDAWSAALRTMVGRPWRGRDDLVHLWHPAQPRESRVVGNTANKNLWLKYRAAKGRAQVMRELIEEGRRECPIPS